MARGNDPQGQGAQGRNAGRRQVERRVFLALIANAHLQVEKAPDIGIGQERRATGEAVLAAHGPGCPQLSYRQAQGQTGAAAEHMQGPFSASPDGKPVGQAETVTKQEGRLAVVPAATPRTVVLPREADVVAEILQPLGQRAERQVVGAHHRLCRAKRVPDHDLGLATAAGHRQVLHGELSRRQRLATHELAVDVDIDGRGCQGCTRELLGGQKHKIGVEAKIACHARPAHQGCPAQGVAGGVHVADYDACQPVPQVEREIGEQPLPRSVSGIELAAGVQQVATDAEPGLCEPVPTSPVGALKVALKVAAPYPVVDEQAGGAVVDDALRPLGPKVKYDNSEELRICGDRQSQTSLVKDEGDLRGQRPQRHQPVLALSFPSAPLDAHPRFLQISHLHDQVIPSQDDQHIADVDLIDSGAQEGRFVLSRRDVGLRKNGARILRICLPL